MSIFVSAGHWKNDSGAVSTHCGKTYKENELTIIQRDLTCKELDKLGVKYIKDNDNESLSQYLSRIKTGSGSVVLEFHFNAFNRKATGVETLVADNASTNSKNFAKELNDITVKILKLPNRGVKTEGQSHRGKLGLMRKEGIVALIELCFIDNCDDVKAWENNKEQLAVEYAKILKKYEDLIQ